MMMAHGIVAVSIITALLPRMSAAAADGRYADVTADLVPRHPDGRPRCSRRSRSCYAVLAVPIAVTLFQRGAFTTDDALRDRARCCWSPRFALVPFSISQLFTFAFYALPDTKTPALINMPVVRAADRRPGRAVPGLHATRSPRPA